MPPMAPRRRSAVVSSSSAASRKAVNQPSQPSKFGIQHFFERHSQSQSQAAAAPVAAPLDPPNINPKPNLNPEPTVDPPPPPTASAGAATNAEEQVSPEITKSAPPKRFKFSPGMLIKQSQDDGGEEVTWRISPVNERLRSLAAKAKGLPMMTSFFSNDASKPNAPTFQPCSTKQNSSSSKGELEKWLWSPTTVVPEKSLASSKRVSAEENNGCVGNGNKMDLQSPFLTPPSVSDGPLELIGGVACNGASDQLTSCQHRKALLELLDQVEDAITEEPVINGHGVNCGDVHMEPSVDGKGSHDASREQTFLVLEVSEKHRSADSLCARYPIKVLRLLNEHSGQERTVHLCDEWFHSIIGPGDTANIIGVFDDEGKCVIDRHSNFLVIHPGILVSGTRVASSFTCPRRSILDERLKCSEHSISALVGTMLHQIFQVGLIKDLPTRDFLEEYAGMVLQKNMESIYACGAHEKDIYATLIEAIPKILNWLKCFRGPEESKDVTIDFGHIDGEKTVSITEVMDIEEMAWAPRYGLKGMIDASVRAKMSSVGGGSSEIIMPLEFKTGKGSNSQPALEHCAQVILYTLLMSERYLEKNIDSGLLYYLQTNQTRGIKVQRSDLVGLIMRRNEFAADLLKASTTQLLPPMLQNSAMCKGCRHLSTCTVYHKAHGGNTKSSGLGDVFDRHVGHLTTAHCDFLKHWDRLIDLESKASQVTKKEILCPNSLVGEHNKNSLSSIILDVKNGFLIANESDNGRFVYHFVCKKLPYDDHEISSGEKTVPLERGASHLDCTLRCGDHVILSTESGHVAVANGVISEITHTHVSISFLRRLRLPGSCSSETGNLIRQVWRIDKNETSSIYAVMRFNLVQLFVQNSWSSHLRKMIVDLEVPRFDSGGMFSQDPALSYVQSEKSLNDDQRRAIHKILSAKDYSLILGMPGTGKTSTMVHAVKALLMRGSSILLTSYTNSAVDNLLTKLKDQAIDFIRIGRHEAVHDDVRGHCFSTMEKRSVEDIKQRMEHVRVVGVTCLGVNHPLLANKTFDICIMDEAGQTTLPVSLGPLMLASTFVLVGDHYQLPPLVQSTEARENGMDISLFRRLSEAHPQAIATLHCQYRMCAGIMELSNALIYGNRLRCGSSEIANAKLRLCNVEPTTLWMEEVLDTNKSVIFVNTDLLPALEVKEHNSVNNPTEAYIISKITGEMLKRGIPEDDIGVITPYNSQATLIRRAVVAPIEIHTIDKYQGRDKECILVSFVRSSENSRACTSSLLGDWHRINVAITRPKKKLIMIGSCKTLSKVPLLKLLIEKVDEQCGILYVSNKDIRHTKVLKKCSHMSVQ